MGLRLTSGHESRGRVEGAARPLRLLDNVVERAEHRRP